MVVGFVALLVVIKRRDEVRRILTDLVHSTLTFAGGMRRRARQYLDRVRLVPALLAVVEQCISGIAVATQHARAQDAAAAAARSLVRGEDTGKAGARVHRISAIASLSSRAEGSSP